MVDCGNSSCAQERRAFKRELLSWSKKIPMAMGLEAIAEQLGGKEKIKILFKPFNDLESEDPIDWKPDQECFYCHSRSKFILETVQQSMNNYGAMVSTDDPGLRYLQQLLPFSYTQLCQRESPEVPVDYSKPLDLSSTPSSRPKSPSRYSSQKDVLSALDPSNIELRVPSVQAKSSSKRKDGSRRAYTEEELHAAVADIRSGKLGTRRAAQIYGVPRSTLRNKIFKMDCVIAASKAQAEQKKSPAKQGEPLMSLDDLMKNNSVDSVATPSKLTPVKGHLFKSEPRENGIEKSKEEWERKLEQIRHKHGLDSRKPRYWDMPFADMIPGHRQRFLVPDWEDDKRRTSIYANELKLPFLPVLVRKLAEERLKSAKEELSNGDGRKHCRRSTSEDEDDEDELSSTTVSPSKTTLKIPSIKRVHAEMNGFANEGPVFSDHSPAVDQSNRVGDTLKDIIAKTIADKMRTRTGIDSIQKVRAWTESCRDLDQPDTSSPSMAHYTPPLKKLRPKPSSESPAASSTTEKTTETPTKASDGSTGKKTRPKRGQYRKYNSQLLMEAVKAVQRGEMSVHRAGSYFGVPHSTLEYKVKERHLLRKKKIAEQKSQQEATSSTSNTTTKAVTSVTQASSAFQGMVTPALYSAPMAGVTPLGFFPEYAIIPPVSIGAGFAVSTPASELLRKLQAKVQSQSQGGTEVDTGDSQSNESIVVQ